MRKPRQNRLEPRKRPRQRRAQATVEDVIEAAAQVFEAFGYAAGTTNRIAERAAVSIGTVYQYFPNKEAIAVALLERHIDEGKRWLSDCTARATAEPRTLHNALWLLVDGMIDQHSDRPRLFHILFEETPLSRRVHEAMLIAEREAAETVAGLLRIYPEVRHPRIAEAATMVVQTVASLTHRFAAHPDQWLPREDFAAELVEMIEVYLTRGPR